MCSDDSLSDSDEITSLYSSKSIINTYNIQLKKLLTSNKYKPVKSVETSKVSNNKVDLTTNKNSFTTISNNKNIIDLSSECSGHSNTSISPKIPRNRARRSERLRKIRTNSIPCNEIISDVNSPPSNCTRKKLRQQGKIIKCSNNVEEIVLDESVEAEDNEAEEEINPEVSVKVIWKSILVKKFKIRKFQKLSKIFQEISKEENIPENNIILTFNHNKVTYYDTPSSLDLHVYDFLEGGEINQSTNSFETVINEALKNNSSLILKFQDSNKKIVMIQMKKDEKMKVGMIKYAEQIEIPLENIQFFFDGELVKHSETAQALGLENGDIIDIKILTKY